MNKIIVLAHDEMTRKDLKNRLSDVIIAHDCCDILEFGDNNRELDSIIKDTSEKKIFIIYFDHLAEIAKKIRHYDIYSEIIFIVEKEEDILSAYLCVNKVYNVLVKCKENRPILINDIITLINNSDSGVRFIHETRKYNYHIFYKDITYITRDPSERKLIIYTTNNRFIITMSLKKITEKLDHRFRRCHKGCIVNKDRVQKFDWVNNCFVLDTKEKIFLLSKTFKYEVL